MSVEKFILRKENSNFTIVSNKVINGLKDKPELLGFYVYLLSLPPDWTFYKTTLKENCRLGIKKLEKFISDLAQMRLIEVAQNRSKDGKFAQIDLHILNGDLFEINNLSKLSTESTRTVSQKPYDGNRTTDLRSYKRNINKININTKETEKLYCASDDARSNFDHIYFYDFWNIYPRKKDKARALKIWKSKKCDRIAPLILKDVKNRLLNSFEWKDEQFIPHPSTYLRNERWNDEFSLNRLPIKNETDIDRAKRVFSEMSGE